MAEKRAELLVRWLEREARVWERIWVWEWREDLEILRVKHWNVGEMMLIGGPV